ncbi:MAG: PHP domain-containing protein [Lachnospirales bacterium]
MIDLHLHSNISDGTDTVEELIAKAKKIGVNVLSLTDHDTIDGVIKAKNLCEEKNIIFINGIELTATYKSYEIHLLAYNFSVDNNIIKDLANKIKEIRNTRNKKMVKKFEEIGINISLDKLNEENKNSIITRTHFAIELLKQGYAETKEDAFNKYLLPERGTYVAKNSVSAEECILNVHKAGGVVILAHPTKYDFFEDIGDVIGELSAISLDGVEAYYNDYTEEESSIIINEAQKNNLVLTGGSDYHGQNKTNINIGIGKGNLKIASNMVYDFLNIIS